MSNVWDSIDTSTYRDAHIGVFYGGQGAEREISLLTGEAFCKALVGKGYRVTGYDLPVDLEKFLAEPADVVLLGLHGDGEEGTIQGLLEVLGVPYTGSGVLSSALSMDKARAKAVMRARQVPVAQGCVVPKNLLKDQVAFSQWVSSFGWSKSGYVVKPTDSGSSYGVYVLSAGDDPAEALEGSLTALREGLATEIMVEQRLTGPEYSVGFFQGTPLGAIRITPASAFYDYEAKYKSTTTQYEYVSDELATRIIEVAQGGWDALGCRGIGRIDVMADGDDFYVLEANTIPGMTATSLVPKLAQKHGVVFEDFVELMVASATTDRLLKGQ